MMKKKLGYLMVVTLLVGLLQACGGGGGGGSDAPSNLVTVSAAGSDNASTADKTYTVVPGTFVYEITGFAANDKLVFPTTVPATVVNESYTDGNVIVQYAIDGKVAQVLLKGYDNATDKSLNFIPDFNTKFGADTISYK